MSRYIKALVYANELHFDQKRKETEIPYLTHLMHVSAYVIEFGGDEDQAIAALLHDAIEDQSERTSLDEIKATFGEEVARIVNACTDARTKPKPPWKERKLAYLEALKTKDQRIKLVVACDKLHNAQSIVRDVQTLGPSVWSRFTAPKEETIWYYKSIVESLESMKGSPVYYLLSEEVKKMSVL